MDRQMIDGQTEASETYLVWSALLPDDFKAQAWSWRQELVQAPGRTVRFLLACSSSYDSWVICFIKFEVGLRS
jgi:hypothetical protein